MSQSGWNGADDEDDDEEQEEEEEQEEPFWTDGKSLSCTALMIMKSKCEYLRESLRGTQVVWRFFVKVGGLSDISAGNITAMRHHFESYHPIYGR